MCLSALQNRFWNVSLFILVFCNLSLAVVRQNKDNRILLHNDLISIDLNEKGIKNIRISYGSDNTKHHFLVKLNGDAKTLLNGMQVVDYVPSSTWIIYATSTQANTIASLEEVEWIDTYRPVHKAHKTLFSALTSRRSTDEVVLTVQVSDSSHEKPAIWSNKLSKFGITAIVKAVTFNKITVTCARSDAERVVSLVSEEPSTYWIELKRDAVLHNKYATKLVQNQGGSSTPIWAKGLQGEDQIISFADTGLDTNHAFFYDSNHPSVSVNTTNTAHRKVLAYLSFADLDEPEPGHGTFVAGCLAGEANSLPDSNGMAPKAKLIVADIGHGSSPTLSPPPSLLDLYEEVYKFGARVHCDSWGSDGSMYSLYAKEIDDFVWYHRDFLIVRSAGNMGDLGRGTITAEANSKNAIVVGATQNSYDSFNDYFQNYFPLSLDILCQVYGVCNLFANETECCGSEFEFYCCPGVAEQMLQSNPSAFNSTNVPTFSSTGPATDGRIKPELVAPGEFIVSALSQIAPSLIPHSNLFASSGTSFAAPFVAGAAAIIRQYFLEGFYVSGNRNLAASIRPTASLLKAMLINSGLRVDGSMVFNGSSYGPIPDTSFFNGASYVQGFGRIQLDKVLRFDDSPFSLWVASNEQEGLQTGESRRYCLRITSPSTLKVTLVWTDPSASPASFLQLINNIDLAVIIDDIIFPGNAMFTYDNGPTKFDFVNNVEQVLLPNLPVDRIITIVVNGADVPLGPQSFSLVITGDGFERIQCRECTLGDSRTCPIDNGVGVQTCRADFTFSNCLVSQCNNGFIVSASGNTCTEFLDYYVFIGYTCISIIGLAVIMLIATRFLPASWSKREVNYTGDGQIAVGILDLFAIAAKELPYLLIGAIAGLISTGASLLQPLWLGYAIEILPTATALSEFTNIFVLIGVFTAIEFVFQFIQGSILSISGHSISRNLRKNLFEAMMLKNYPFFDTVSEGDLLNRLSVDADTLRDFLATALNTVFISLARVITGTVLLFVISWKLSLVFFAMIPVILLIAFIYGAFAQRYTVLFLDRLAKTSETAMEVLGNIRIVHYFNMQRNESMRYSEAVERFYRIAKKFTFVSVLQSSASTLVTEIIAIALLLYGFHMVIEKEITQGLLLSFFLYIGLTAGAVGSFSSLFTSYKQAVGSSQRILEIINTPPGKPSLIAKPWGGNRKLDPLRGDIKFDKIIFEYPSRPDAQVLKNVTISIPAGKTVAVVGYVGSGKSTLTHLLLGLYQPKSGRILVDGADLADVDITWMHSQVGIVEQDPRLFNISISDNISYGCGRRVTREDIIVAAQRAKIHDFINTLPERYDTLVGENGSFLSGGQRKQISIARAILRNAPILILDEPTAGLDSENTDAVTQSLNEFMRTKTTLIIAHDLPTIMQADRIYVIKKGRIAEEGSHEELMAIRGIYAELIGKFEKKFQKRKTQSPPPKPTVLPALPKQKDDRRARASTASALTSQRVRSTTGLKWL